MERRLLLLQLDQCALQWMKSSSVVVGLSKYVFTSSSSTFSVACKPLLVAHRYVESLSKKKPFLLLPIYLFFSSQIMVKLHFFGIFFYFSIFAVFGRCNFRGFFIKKNLGGKSISNFLAYCSLFERGLCNRFFLPRH